MTGPRAAVRRSHRASGRRILVLDDDPTGSQAVHGVEAVMGPGADGAITRALAAPGSTCFVLTNSRSLPEPEAYRVALRLGRLSFALEDALGGPVQVVSRSDSTLRGHVRAEVEALDEARRLSRGHGYDGVLLVPSYLEAGRFTAGDIHWARVDGQAVPVAETEYARDSAFGYSSSDLRSFLEEKSAGAIAAPDVASISLEDIRSGGPGRVSQILAGLGGAGTGGSRFVVVNATEYADLDTVALGMLAAQDQGRSYLVRSGPSFVRSLAGLEPLAPVRSAAIWPRGRPDGHGLVVVGSHVELTNRQLEVLARRGGTARVDVDVDALVEGAGEVVAGCAAQVRWALGDHDVVLVTTRAVRTGADGQADLAISRAVSAGLAGIVAHGLAARPAWVMAKGGITSHDVLVEGLGIRRAEVVGQLFPGYVSVFRPVEARPEAIGLACVIFAGNVGDDAALAAAVDILSPGA